MGTPFGDGVENPGVIKCGFVEPDMKKGYPSRKLFLAGYGRNAV